MQEPLVRVVIPTFNRRDQCLAAVQMAQHQTYGNVDIAVIVDCSTDGTFTSLMSYRDGLPSEQAKRLHLRVNTSNRGPAATRNRGLFLDAEETGIPHADFLALFDDDDGWEPDKLKEQIKELQKHPNGTPLICGTNTVLNYPDQQPIIVDTGNQLTVEEMYRFGSMPTPSWMFSRHTRDTIGRFDERLRSGEDPDYLLRLDQAGGFVIRVPKALTIINASPSGKYDNDAGAAAILYEKHAAWVRERYPKLFEEIMAAPNRSIRVKYDERSPTRAPISSCRHHGPSLG